MTRQAQRMVPQTPPDTRPTMPEDDVPPEGLPHDIRAGFPDATMPDGTAERRRIGDFTTDALVSELARRGFAVSNVQRYEVARKV